MNTQETIITRRSVREYTQEQLSPEDLNTILDAAYASPIGAARYWLMHLTVIPDPELLSQINDYYKEKLNTENDMLHGAPTLIIVSGDQTAPDTMLYANTGCIIENIQLSAWELGLGSVFDWSAGTVLPQNDELLKCIGIPEDFKPLAGVVIGRPANEVPGRELKMTIETNFIR